MPLPSQPEADPGFGFRGQVERQRRKYRGAVGATAPRVYGVGYEEGCNTREGSMCTAPSQKHFFFIIGSRNAYFDAFFGPLEYLLLHCYTLVLVRPGPDLYTPSQSDIPG